MNKKSIIVIIAVTAIFAYLHLDNKEMKQEQNRLLEEQVAELEYQNALKEEELLKQQEAAEELRLEKEKEEEAERLEKLQAASCFNEYFEIIYPYYGYNDNAFDFCLKELIPNYGETLGGCQKTYNDRVAGLDAKVEEAKKDCNYTE